MQARSTNQSIDASNPLLGMTSAFVDSASLSATEETPDTMEPTHFRGHYASCMEMLADAPTVVAYLDDHRTWFRRCAQPMDAAPLGDNGYALTIGRFGAFGYEVEPKIGLNLLPQDQRGFYRIETIDIPDYVAPGYEVDFQAALHMVQPADAATDNPAEPMLTRVEWELDLAVSIQFPRFIQALPKALVQTTGDRLLNQIVRQVSRRLTHKVQDDFHSSHGIPFSRKRKWS
ncbi:DUF1997 domain-containing protein [Thermoleptolyngbya oregonensis NK1-22]|uniref:DUF1997 domain-containing protein n=2 Tax=Thermoleptolyngbya TaxID=2303528 RepID=A0AA96Y0N1_9CYAN|nr:DUF1997 domain-containing protein [Thermoleptolyngbya oregonensis NK1-22]